jgi:hypothetical protein
VTRPPTTVAGRSSTGSAGTLGLQRWRLSVTGARRRTDAGLRPYAEPIRGTPRFQIRPASTIRFANAEKGFRPSASAIPSQSATETLAWCFVRARNETFPPYAFLSVWLSELGVRPAGIPALLTRRTRGSRIDRLRIFILGSIRKNEKFAWRTARVPGSTDFTGLRAYTASLDRLQIWLKQKL